MAKILELKNYTSLPTYETDYKYVVKDKELLWEVANHLTNDSDFANARVSIGQTSHKNYDPRSPHFYIDNEGGLNFALFCLMESYEWEWEKEKRKNLGSLIKKHVNPNFRFVNWKSLTIKNRQNEIVSGHERESDIDIYSYQFSKTSNEQQFLRELEEALKIQQIILSEQDSFLKFSSSNSFGMIIGNPYLYSLGHLWRGAKPEAIAKFRKMTDDYLMKRLPDIEEARRIFSGIVPQLYEAEIEIEQLKEENNRLRPANRLRVKLDLKLQKLFRRLGDVEESEIEKRCQVLGIDAEFFNSLPYEQATRFVKAQKRFFGEFYHSQGQFFERMKDVNAAADFLMEDLSKKQQ